MEASTLKIGSRYAKSEAKKTILAQENNFIICKNPDPP
jgi:hypothetical protein